jgi:hypothetical protein
VLVKCGESGTELGEPSGIKMERPEERTTPLKERNRGGWMDGWMDASVVESGHERASARAPLVLRQKKKT